MIGGWSRVIHTEPLAAITPFGVKNIPDPMIVPTMIPTPLKSVISLFNFTSEPFSLLATLPPFSFVLPISKKFKIA